MRQQFSKLKVHVERAGPEGLECMEGCDVRGAHDGQFTEIKRIAYQHHDGFSVAFPEGHIPRINGKDSTCYNDLVDVLKEHRDCGADSVFTIKAIEALIESSHALMVAIDASHHSAKDLSQLFVGIQAALETTGKKEEAFITKYQESYGKVTENLEQFYIAV